MVITATGRVWCSEIARRSRLASRSTLGAILPLHDVRQHAPASDLVARKPCGSKTLRHDGGRGTCVSTDEQATAGQWRPRLVEPDGIEPTTSCLQSRRSPN